ASDFGRRRTLLNVAPSRPQGFGQMEHHRGVIAPVFARSLISHAQRRVEAVLGNEVRPLPFSIGSPPALDALEGQHGGLPELAGQAGIAHFAGSFGHDLETKLVTDIDKYVIVRAAVRRD